MDGGLRSSVFSSSVKFCEKLKIENVVNTPSKGFLKLLEKFAKKIEETG
jgi:hypothetical protein